MNTDIKLGTIGGDLRSIVCAKELSQKGFESAVFGFSEYEKNFGSVTRVLTPDGAIRYAKAVILPLPVSTDGITLNAPFLSKDVNINDLFSMFAKEQLILAGHICDKTYALAKKCGLKIIDYYEREEFKIANAVPTAEGALAIAINETPITIHSSRCLVLGYGRIGKVLCKSLKNFGAKVYAAARKYSDFAWIKAEGYTPIHIDDIVDVAPNCDIIFNTVPKLLIGKELLNKISKSTLILDLASKPGGVDFDSAKELGLNVIWALSLPGKVAPLTSGKIMCESIENILKEEGII